VEGHYPNLKDIATQPQLRDTELRLQKEIKEVEIRLQEVEARLQKEIHALDLKIAETNVKIAETKAELIRWVVGVGLLQTALISGMLLKIAHLI
jgi:hypothetical protein